MDPGPVLQPDHPIAYYGKKPDRKLIKPGMIVYTHVSIPMALNSTKLTRSQQTQVPTLSNEQLGLDMVTQDSYQLSLQRTNSRQSTIGSGAKPRAPLRPCVVLFVDKPNADTVIVAPITSRRGHHADDPEDGLTNDADRLWHFPIPDTPSHQVRRTVAGQPEVVLQEIADVPNWKWRRDKAGELNLSPQYLVIGTPVKCRMKKLTGLAWECHYFNSSGTEWCQRMSIGLMCWKEILDFQLRVERDRLGL